MSEILTHRNGEEPGDERPRLVLDTNTVLALWMFHDPALDELREWIEAAASSPSAGAGSAPVPLSTRE